MGQANNTKGYFNKSKRKVTKYKLKSCCIVGKPKSRVNNLYSFRHLIESNIGTTIKTNTDDHTYNIFQKFEKTAQRIASGEKTKTKKKREKGEITL